MFTKFDHIFKVIFIKYSSILPQLPLEQLISSIQSLTDAKIVLLDAFPNESKRNFFTFMCPQVLLDIQNLGGALSSYSHSPLYQIPLHISFSCYRNPKIYMPYEALQESLEVFFNDKTMADDLHFIIDNNPIYGSSKNQIQLIDEMEHNSEFHIGIFFLSFFLLTSF